jgi:hypothetical protein
LRHSSCRRQRADDLRQLGMLQAINRHRPKGTLRARRPIGESEGLGGINDRSLRPIANEPNRVEHPPGQ